MSNKYNMDHQEDEIQETHYVPPIFGRITYSRRSSQNKISTHELKQKPKISISISSMKNNNSKMSPRFQQNSGSIDEINTNSKENYNSIFSPRYKQNSGKIDENSRKSKDKGRSLTPRFQQSSNDETGLKKKKSKSNMSHLMLETSK